MWQVYVYGFLAGVIGANGVPYFIKGVMGKSNHTPLGKSSSAYINVVWGWLNLVVASLLLYYSHFHQHLLRAFASVAVGALLSGLLLASIWAKAQKSK